MSDGAPDLFDWNERYPHEPGFKERGGTSEAAARDIAPAAPYLRGRVLACLRDRGPATPDECAGRLELDILSVRPRFSELARRGLIQKTGERRPNHLVTLGSRALGEFLDELGRREGVTAAIHRQLDNYAKLTPEMLRAVGADRWATAPLRAIREER